MSYSKTNGCNCSFPAAPHSPQEGYVCDNPRCARSTYAYWRYYQEIPGGSPWEYACGSGAGCHEMTIAEKYAATRSLANRLGEALGAAALPRERRARHVRKLLK